MTRAQKVAEAQRLRAGGLPSREIATRLGTSDSTVRLWLSDPDQSKQRARHRRYAGTCVDCRRPTNGSAGPGKAPRRCAECYQRHRYEQRHWTPQTCAAALRAWAQDLRRTPTAREAQRPGAPVNLRAVQREFGSWSAGIAAAGLTPRPPHRPRKRDQVIA